MLQEVEWLMILNVSKRLSKIRNKTHPLNLAAETSLVSLLSAGGGGIADRGLRKQSGKSMRDEGESSAERLGESMSLAGGKGNTEVICQFWTFPINGIISVAFVSGFSHSVSIMFSRSIHIVAGVRSSFLFTAE